MGIDIDADLCLDLTVGGRFTQKPMTEQVKFLESFLKRHTSSVIKTRTLQAKVMSSVDESSLVESKPIPSFSLDSTYEPSPEPRTPKKRIIHPSEFPIKFDDYGNTSKLFWHNPHEVAFPKVEPSKEWLMKVKRFSEAIWILSPSMTMPYSLRGIVVNTLHNPTVETNIMSEFLAKNLLGNMPLVPTNKLFKSPT